MQDVAASQERGDEMNEWLKLSLNINKLQMIQFRLKMKENLPMFLKA